MNFRADLHCHSTCSDGTMSPEELIAHAKEIGLSGVSITDHDCIAAYKTAIPAAKKLGIRLGSGIELSSVDAGISVHVLGYDFDLDSPQLHALCAKHIERRKQRNQRILEKLANKGMRVELAQDKVLLGRPHIALALVEKGYVKSVQEAFKQLIGDGKSCFDPGEPVGTDETIEVIHNAGGKAFLAHPHLMKGKRLIEKLLEKPFDGIECYYSKCGPEQEKKWVDIAHKKGLMVSGGSDFHGSIKPGIPLGCSWVDEVVFNGIFETHQWK